MMIRGRRLLIHAGAPRGHHLGRSVAAARGDGGSGVRHEMNRAMTRLAERGPPSVVPIQVTGFRPAGPNDTVASAVVAR